MSLQFVIGPSGSGKTEKIYSEVLNRALAHPDINYLILVPDQFGIQTQRDIVEKSPNHGILNIDVLSFSRLCHRIFDEAGGNDRKPLNDIGKTMILRRIASLKEEDLPVIGGNMRKPGYINEVKSVISEFMQYDISPDTLSEILGKNEKRPGLSGKLSDLQTLYRGYLDYVKEKYITSEDILDHALVMAPKAPFLKNCEVFLDGYTGFTPVQLRFLGELMKLTRQVTVTVTMGREALLEDPDRADETDLFLLGKKTVSALKKRADEANCPVQKPILCNDPVNWRLKNAPELCYLEENLFRKGYRRPYQGKCAQVRMAQLPDVRSEVTWIGRQIHSLVREEGYRYREIAVLTADVNAYENVLLDEMKKYEIPVFVDTRRSVLLNPYTELLRSALEVIVKDWSYESIMRYLKSGMSDLTREEVHLLDRYMVAAGIRRKRDFHKEWTFVTRHEKAETLPYYNELRLRLVQELEELSKVVPPRKRENCEKLVRGLYDFIVSRRAYEKIEERKAYFEEESAKEDGREHNQELARVREYEKLYQEVLDLFDRMMELLSGEKMTAAEFSDILDAGLSEITIGIPPVSMDQVIVGDLERTRLPGIKVLFLMGVNDGRIPMDSHKRGILSELDRQVLRAQEYELAPTTREQAFTQRFYLYMYLTKPSERLYLTYPLVEANGDAVHPSYLIGTIGRLYGDMKPETPETELPTDALYTATEGLQQMVNHLRDEEPPKELMAYFYREDHYRQLLEHILEQAFTIKSGNPISQAVAAALYGSSIRGTVTRLEKYASCAYSYFLQYGLKLFEKEEFGFETKDLGNVYHEVLKRYSNRIEAEGYSWLSIPAEKSEEILDEVLREVLEGADMTVLHSGARYAYKMRQIERMMKRTVAVLSYQAKKGTFMPAKFEWHFQKNIPLEGTPAEAENPAQLNLVGTIDRVDVCETEDSVYVKIMDYKSGNRKLNLVSIYHGTALQLVVYMNAAAEEQAHLHPEKDIKRAGILYYHIDDPLISVEKPLTEEEIEEKLKEKLRMDGFVSSDPESYLRIDEGLGGASYKSDVIPGTVKKDGDLDANTHFTDPADLELISNYVNHKVASLAQEILSGRIDVDPYSEKADDLPPASCTFCNYREICGFRRDSGSECRVFPNETDETYLDKMREEIEGEAE